MQLAAARSPLSAEAVAVEWSWLLEGRACPATARALHACARRFGCADIWTRQDSQPARAERVLWHQLWQRAAALAPRYIPGRSSQEGAVVVLDPHPPGKPMVLDLDSLLVEKRTNNLSEERSSGSIRARYGRFVYSCIMDLAWFASGQTPQPATLSSVQFGSQPNRPHV